MSRATLASFALCCLFAVVPPAAAGERGLLWRVVQTCLVNHNLTGASFPCLAVDTTTGAETGYAVLRAPLEDTHIIVTPTVRTIGIEAERLRGPKAPDYFHDAWLARHFVVDDQPGKPQRDDIGLAVNSRLGRSQDQLHIHVDCLRPDVKSSLDRQSSSIRPKIWTRISVLPQAPHYWATALPSVDLAHLNVFDIAADGLKIDGPDDMVDVTIVVAGARSVEGAPGFTLLARKRRSNTSDLAHGEALLDHSCAVLHGTE